MGATNLYDWQQRLDLASKKLVGEQVIRFQKNLVFLTLGAAIELSPGNMRRIMGVVLRTPVLTGRARASWNVSIGSMDLSYPEGSSGFQAITQSKAASLISNLAPYDVVWVANGLPYIEVLEFGGYPNPPSFGTWIPSRKAFEIRSANGYSKGAPNGMLRVTLAEIAEAIR